ncbi:MAG: thiamine-phosphate kinase [bacterium]
MELSRIGEFGLIERIARQEKRRPSTVVGIGDDCAVLKGPGSRDQGPAKYQLITTDTFIEKVHFKIPPKNGRKPIFYHLGRKVMVANISDISAMGGWPTHALVTVGLPRTIKVEEVDQLYRGINSLAKKHKIDIVGGDTVSSPKAMVVSITLLGEVEKENLLLRSTAKVGDLICVTGKFGRPASKKYDSRTWSVESRTQEARMIAKSRMATAMIDSSDGLVRSVLEICKASGVGAKIYEAQVPIAKGATLDQALYGGEEYELVFTVRGKSDSLLVPRQCSEWLEWRATRLSSSKSCRAIGELVSKKGFTVVGEIVNKQFGVKLIDKRGKIKRLKSGGYEHFK